MGSEGTVSCLGESHVRSNKLEPEEPKFTVVFVVVFKVQSYMDPQPRSRGAASAFGSACSAQVDWKEGMRVLKN